MEQIDPDGVERLITTYLSNVPPPQIGSVMDLGTFFNAGTMEYKVVGVATSPHRSDNVDLDDVADYADVQVLLKKMESLF